MAENYKAMKILTIGYGSIGQRHSRIFAELECEVAVVTRRKLSLDYPTFSQINQGIKEWKPDNIIVCSETSRHKEDLDTIVNDGFNGKVLVEKPVGFQEQFFYPNSITEKWFAAYVMRFIPVMQEVKKWIENQSPTSVEVRACSYLPNWRPQRDYTESYSAQRALGGGVLYDLSHELDYIYWLFGPWKSISAIGGQLSWLDIDSDDIFFTMMQLESKCIVNISLNYIDREEERWIIVNCEKGTLKADIVKGEIYINGSLYWKAKNCSFDQSYYEQAKAFLSHNKSNELCSFQDGLITLETIHHIEKANRDKKWIIK